MKTLPSKKSRVRDFEGRKTTALRSQNLATTRHHQKLNSREFTEPIKAVFGAGNQRAHCFTHAHAGPWLASMELLNPSDNLWARSSVQSIANLIPFGTLFVAPFIASVPKVLVRNRGEGQKGKRKEMRGRKWRTQLATIAVAELWNKSPLHQARKEMERRKEK